MVIYHHPVLLGFLAITFIVLPGCILLQGVPEVTLDAAMIWLALAAATQKRGMFIGMLIYKKSGINIQR